MPRGATSYSEWRARRSWLLFSAARAFTTNRGRAAPGDVYTFTALMAFLVEPDGLSKAALALLLVVLAYVVAIPLGAALGLSCQPAAKAVSNGACAEVVARKVCYGAVGRGGPVRRPPGPGPLLCRLVLFDGRRRPALGRSIIVAAVPGLGGDRAPGVVARAARGARLPRAREPGGGAVFVGASARSGRRTARRRGALEGARGPRRRGRWTSARCGPSALAPRRVLNVT